MAEGATISALFDRVLEPLVLGGSFHPLDPIGPADAASIAQQAARGISAADASWVTVARVRKARSLCPVDALPEVDEAQWWMLIALHDLIRSTDPEVNSLFSPDRNVHIIQGAMEMLAQVPAARTVGEALSRHATFAGMLSLERKDTMVAWWCGSRRFIGRPAPERLLAWPRVRRVRSQSAEVDLTSMVSGNEAVQASFLEGLQALLARTPLTDLAAAGRRAPAFAWSSPTVSLLSGRAGRKLALRALRSGAAGNPLAAIRKASESITPPPSASVRRTVQGVIRELEEWGRAA